MADFGRLHRLDSGTAKTPSGDSALISALQASIAAGFCATLPDGSRPRHKYSFAANGGASEWVRAVRTHREKELEEKFVCSLSLCITGAPKLATDLVELAGPKRQDR